MIRANGCSQQTETERKDQTIGRIIRLLSALSLKELDAMADRLGRDLPTPCARRSNPPGDGLAQPKARELFGENATATTECCADTVGQ